MYGLELNSYSRNGDAVNIEVDIIAKYVEKLSQGTESGITEKYLEEHGFGGF